MDQPLPELATMARRHGLSDAAGEALFAALVAGGGGQAQFSHAELGGMGQWSGGMTQIGDMFNDSLKAKIGGFCQAMSEAARAERNSVVLPATSPQADARAPLGRTASPWARRSESWWPAHFGEPTASGAQNDVGYACFPDLRRLAVLRGGTVTIYDTGAHRINGIAQQQSSDTKLVFSSSDGAIALHALRIVPR